MEVLGVTQMFSSYTKIADTLQLESDMHETAPVDHTPAPSGGRPGAAPPPAAGDDWRLWSVPTLTHVAHLRYNHAVRIPASGSVSRVMTRVHGAAELAAAAMFAIMFAAFLVGVVSRYVFNDPVSWSIEVCSIAYVWIVFFSGATIVPMSQHITFDMLYKAARPGVRRAFAIVSAASIGLVFLAGLPTTLEYIGFVGQKRTLMLHIPLSYVYSCFGIFMVAAIIRSALVLRTLLGRDGQSHG
jgi:TRAP-type C4-dicarboxylate transport system permease small subunit